MWSPEIRIKEEIKVFIYKVKGDKEWAVKALERIKRKIKPLLRQKLKEKQKKEPVVRERKTGERQMGKNVKGHNPKDWDKREHTKNNGKLSLPY